MLLLDCHPARLYGRAVKTNDFDYFLPMELIAQQPTPCRDASRMMVIDRTCGTWEHRIFSDLPGYLQSGDVMAVNNTRVIPARLTGRKPDTGGKVEVFLLEEVGPGTWDVLLRSRRRPKPGDSFTLGSGDRPLVVTMVEEGALGRAVVRFDAGVSVLDWATEFGDTPLPPYIRRAGGSSTGDRERYQTVFARHPGAVAAPTAGLHFTPEVLHQLAGMGVARAELTLHVGIGTFRPVIAEDVHDHRMEQERYVVTADAASVIRSAKSAGGRCLAVGSTSVRTLEAVAAVHGELRPAEGRTDLFIYPPYAFRVVDMILTNFHLPKSTLLMMMSAFAGRDLMLAAYEDAVKERYRFFSYGDCMLIV